MIKPKSQKGLSKKRIRSLIEKQKLIGDKIAFISRVKKLIKNPALKQRFLRIASQRTLNAINREIKSPIIKNNLRLRVKKESLD